MTIKQKITDIVEELIYTLNEPLTDDGFVDALEDYDNWVEACDYLIELVEKIKEDGY